MTTLAMNYSTCMRCKRLYSEHRPDADMWTVNFFQGYPVGLLCLTCQTPDEFLEAETNTAKLEGAELVSFSSLEPAKRAEVIIEMICKSAHIVIEKHRKKAERAGHSRVRVDVRAWAAEAAAGVPAIQGQSKSFRAKARAIAADYISGALGLAAHAPEA